MQERVKSGPQRDRNVMYVLTSSLLNPVVHMCLVCNFVRIATATLIFWNFFVRLQKPSTVACPLLVLMTVPSQNLGLSGSCCGS